VGVNNGKAVPGAEQAELNNQQLRVFVSIFCAFYLYSNNK